MASIQERKKKNGDICWRVQIRKNGAKELSKTFGSKEQAEDWAISVENFLEGKLTIPKLPLSVWIERFKEESSSELKSYLDFWRDCLGKEIAIDLKASFIEFFADQLLEKINRHGKKNSPETRRKSLCALGLLYKTAIRDWKWAEHNPVIHIKKISRDPHCKESKNQQTNDLVFEMKKDLLEFVSQYLKNNNKSVSSLGRDIEKQIGRKVAKSTVQCLLNPHKNIYISQFAMLMKHFNKKMILVDQ